MKRVFMATVAIMILLQTMLAITAYASTGLVMKHYRTELAKGEVVEDITVDDEFNTPVMDEELVGSLVVDDIATFDAMIMDEDSTEPVELIEENEPDVAEDEVLLDGEENTGEITTPLATPTDYDEALIIDDSLVDEYVEEEIMEEEIEESQNETEIQESE